MKISLAWLLDHISGISYDSINVTGLVDRFNRTVAEIGACEQWHFNSALFTLMRVKSCSLDSVTGLLPEYNASVTLPGRSDARENDLFLLYTHEGSWRWVTVKDLGSTKDGLLCAVSCADAQVAGDWKKTIETNDYIFDIDNKSITHRADLWCHRGMAREIAPLINGVLLPENKLFKNISIARAIEKIDVVSNTNACSRFALMRLPAVRNKPTSISLALRLARIDAKPINTLVDATNYVMFDIGQPLHAFDAGTIQGNLLQVRMAHHDESLALLDGTTIQLRSEDMVIADAHSPLSLAGVMGGKSASIAEHTHAVLVESATFDAPTVRRAALAHKKRTESSTRFEKTLDPHNNLHGLYRYVALLKQEGVLRRSSIQLVSLGQLPESTTITVDHAYIETIIGQSVEQSTVIAQLKSIGFGVRIKKIKRAVHYIVTVPSWRAGKDIRVKQDIIEEIARLWGYEQVIPTLPAHAMKSNHISDAFDRIAYIKKHAAFGMRAQEVLNYAVYDEPFLQKIQIEPRNAVAVINPISSQAYRLVTSLMPHLCKNWVTNKGQGELLRFFELNKCWRQEGDRAIERLMFAALWYNERGVSFYDEKETLDSLFTALQLPIVWQKATVDLPWFQPYQTAQLMNGGTLIGYAGLMHSALAQQLGMKTEPFIVEIDVDALLALPVTKEQYRAPAKFPSSSFDISMLVPLAVTVAQLETFICTLDTRIVDVSLIDFFEKQEWHDVRSITLRCALQDNARTLEKAAVDALYGIVIEQLKTRYQVTIR
ncbi:MAG: phenylalanine--tRNA ligase subunit beta [Candidatus Babeliales bacterium]